MLRCPAAVSSRASRCSLQQGVLLIRPQVFSHFLLTVRSASDSLRAWEMTMRAHLITRHWRLCASARWAACRRGEAPRLARALWVLPYGQCMAGWRATGAAVGAV